VTGEVTEAVKVTAVPIMDGLFDEVTTEEELAVWLIVCVRIGESAAGEVRIAAVDCGDRMRPPPSAPKW